MLTMNVHDKIAIDPKIMHGKPVIKDTRIPVYVVLSLLAGGMKEEEIIREYPDLTKKDIAACLEHAAQLAQEEFYALEV